MLYSASVSHALHKIRSPGCSFTPTSVNLDDDYPNIEKSSQYLDNPSSQFRLINAASISSKCTQRRKQDGAVDQ